MAQLLRNPTSNREIRSLALPSGLRIWCCGELWCRSQPCSGPTLLWLWCRQAVRAPIQSLAWEPPYASGVALQRQKTKKKKKEYSQNCATIAATVTPWSPWGIDSIDTKIRGCSSSMVTAPYLWYCIHGLNQLWVCSTEGMY